MTSPLLAPLRPLLPALALLAAWALPAAAQFGLPTWTASDLDAFDEYGRSVDVSGDWAAVGAWRADDGGVAGGKVYLLERLAGGWVEKQVLTSPVPTPAGHFGVAVCLEGLTLAVGASGEQAAYVYEFDGVSWVESARFTAPAPVFPQTFGNAVDLDASASTLVVGDTGAGLGPFLQGAAALFEKPAGGWVDTNLGVVLSASTNEPTFATTVAIEGDTVAVGHPSADLGTSAQGLVRVFTRPGGGWVDATEDATLLASDPVVAARLGEFGLAADGDTIVAGAPAWDDGSGLDTGAVYCFERPLGGWSGLVTETQRLTPSNGTFQDRFGDGLDLDEGRALVVGASNRNGGTYDGSAYLFRWTGSAWAEQTELIPADGGGRAGLDVALDGSNLLVGASEAFQPGGVILSGAVSPWIIEDFALVADRTVVAPGESITLTATGGEPGAALGLILLEVDGLPLVLLLDVSSYDAFGRWSLSAPYAGGVPSTLKLVVKGHAAATGGLLQLSNTVDVEFL